VLQAGSGVKSLRNYRTFLEACGRHTAANIPPLRRHDRSERRKCPACFAVLRHYAPNLAHHAGRFATKAYGRRKKVATKINAPSYCARVFAESIRGVIASRSVAKQSPHVARRLLRPAKNAGLAMTLNKVARL
jgi:hypothetical protein